MIYLELPLSRHYFCIGARYIDSSIQTGTVMSFEYIATKHSVRSNSAVVWPCSSNDIVMQTAKLEMNLNHPSYSLRFLTGIVVVIKQ